MVGDVVTSFIYARHVHMICLLDSHPSGDLLRVGIFCGVSSFFILLFKGFCSFWLGKLKVFALAGS